jgi:cell division protein ZapB
MPSSRPDKAGTKKRRKEDEPCDFAQLGLDFSATHEYSNVPRKETETMNHELFETLENKINGLLEKYNSLKDENLRLKEENQQLTEDNQRLQSEREGLKSRVDAILGKLEGI